MVPPYWNALLYSKVIRYICQPTQILLWYKTPLQESSHNKCVADIGCYCYALLPLRWVLHHHSNLNELTLLDMNWQHNGSLVSRVDSKIFDPKRLIENWGMSCCNQRPFRWSTGNDFIGHYFRLYFLSPFFTPLPTFLIEGVLESKKLRRECQKTKG